MTTAPPLETLAPTPNGGPSAPARSAPEGLARTLARRWWPAVAECVVAVATALGFTARGVTVANSPVTRVGQVSGLSNLQFRLALLVLVVLAVVGWATVRGSERVRAVTVRLAAAAVAG
ncbi:hypothetical protein ABT136_30425, partial [Streptomyces sp. NPDC001856]